MNKVLLEFINTLDSSMKQFQIGDGFSKLTIHQLQYLEQITALETPTISEIALHMGFSKPSVTDAVKKLEKMGFVTKERSDNDRRVVHVLLTDTGDQFRIAKERTLKHYEDFIQSSLDAKEAAQFEHILEKLVTAFKDHNNLSGEHS